MRKLWLVLTPRQRVQVLLLLVGMQIGAALEAIAVGLVFPFVSLANRLNLAEGRPRLLSLLANFGITRERDAWIASAVVMLGFYLLKNIFLTVLTYLQYRFVYRGQSALSCRLLNAYLCAPWSFHLQRNTAELLRNVTSEVELLFGNILIPIVALLTEVSVAVAIIVMLMVVDPVTSAAAIVLLGGSTAAFYSAIRHNTTRVGAEQQLLRGNMIRWVNQALGGIKETKVSGREGFFVDSYAKNTRELARANTYLATVSQLPRFFLETLIVCGIGVMAVTELSRPGEASTLLATLALFSVAAYRLMPSMTRIVAAITNVRYHQSAVDVVHGDLARCEEASSLETIGPASGTKITFQKAIELRNVSYRYPGASQHSLNDLSLVIPKGASVALLGSSGAGKTTVVDVILGLLQQSAGEVLVDARDVRQDLTAWQRRIGYIPQTIYLSDDTLRRNVAFGVSDAEIDEAKVWSALRDAQLDGFVRSLPAGLETLTGERGVRLSGGQRQRIGIARALYHDPDVLVLDEATSSLDLPTEREIIKAIEALRGRKTVIIVAHRPSTVENCDFKYEIGPSSAAGASTIQGLPNG